MARSRRLPQAVISLALLAPLSTVACGPKEPEVVKANVVAGDMPAEGKWRGVWYSQTYGYLHLETEGSNAHGKWRTAAGDKWGELHGTTEGDLLRFDWVEHKIGMFGPNAESSGKGYFKYIVPKEDNADHEIAGEWGLGEDEAGYTWTAIKQRRMEPDLNSVMPDEAESAVEGADWDGTKSDAASGTPEESGTTEEKSGDPAEDDGWE